MPNATFYPGESSDDCRLYFYTTTPNFSLPNTELFVGWTNSLNTRYGSGIRFIGVTIPKGATINTARLILIASSSDSVTVVNARITGEDVDDAATWSTVEDYQARRGVVVGGATDEYLTSAQVDWDAIPAWTKEASYNSPEIKTIIQEIVNRGGWESGNALVLWWDDHDNRSDPAADGCRRYVASYDHATYDPPALYVEWEPPVTFIPTVTIV